MFFASRRSAGAHLGTAGPEHQLVNVENKRRPVGSNEAHVSLRRVSGGSAVENNLRREAVSIEQLRKGAFLGGRSAILQNGRDGREQQILPLVMTLAEARHRDIRKAGCDAAGRRFAGLAAGRLDT